MLAALEIDCSSTALVDRRRNFSICSKKSWRWFVHPRKVVPKSAGAHLIITSTVMYLSRMVF
jgi:hypothetical protein